MSVENWKAVFDAIGVLAVVLALIAGVGVLRCGNIINERQSAQLRIFDKALTDAKILLEQERIRRLELEAAIAPRTIRLTKEVVDRLRREAGTILHIEYRPGEETQRLAEQIREITHWGEWEVTVAPSKESEFKFPFRELREGVSINGDGAGFPRDDASILAVTRLPKFRAAQELSRLLGANDIEATLSLDLGFFNSSKPIVVKVWPKPLPYSAKAKLGTSLDLFGNPSISREFRERNDAEERGRVETNERLRKEWYPDGEQ